MYLEVTSIVAGRARRPTSDFTAAVGARNLPRSDGRGLTPLSASAFFSHEFLVVSGGKQGIQLLRILQRQLQHPRSVSIFINCLRRSSEGPVHLGNGPGSGRV